MSQDEFNLMMNAFVAETAAAYIRTISDKLDEYTPERLQTELDVEINKHLHNIENILGLHKDNAFTPFPTKEAMPIDHCQYLLDKLHSRQRMLNANLN